MRTIMPIMHATLLSEIPFEMLVPHEKQALNNHSQTLNRLAERGGLSVGEAIAILEGKGWASIKECIENERWLINKVRDYKIAQRKTDEDS